MSTPEDASEQVNRLDQAALDPGSDVDFPSEEIHRMLAWLTRNLRGRFVGQIAETDLEEIASDAVQRFMTAARQGRVSASGNPSGYLARIAMNAAIDRLRKDHRMTLVDPSDLVDLGGSYATDDEIAARLDGRADASLIRRALSAARGAGDSTVVRVVTHLLEEIERTGEVPSARAAGAALGLSHTGVAKALERFRAILGRTGASTTGD